MDGQQVLTMAGVTGFLGIIMPPLTRFFVRFGWSKRSTDLVILVLLVVVAGAAAFLVGNINPFACSGTKLPECLAIVVGYVNLTLVQALAWYKCYWEDSAVSAKIAGK